LHFLGVKKRGEVVTMNLAQIVTKEHISDIKLQIYRWPNRFLIDVDLPTQRTSIYQVTGTMSKVEFAEYEPCPVSIGGTYGKYSRSDLSKAILQRIVSKERESKRLLLYGERNKSEFNLYEKLTNRSSQK